MTDDVPTPDPSPDAAPDASATPWSRVDHAGLTRTVGAARAAGEHGDLARLTELLGVVYRLRDPDGCPWDREQTVESMAHNLVEEACETVDAIAAEDDVHVAEELGDTLMNILLMSRIAAQDRRFDLGQVAERIAEKLVRRHPHVFGDRTADDADEAVVSWNESKAREGSGEPRSALDGVAGSLPALLAALKIGEKAAATGFDWPDASGALEKLDEELRELREAVAGRDETASRRMEEELGDVLFSAVNVARKLHLDPELALRRTVDKFRKRFAAVEEDLGPRLREAPLQEMEDAWRRAADAESRD